MYKVVYITKWLKYVRFCGEFSTLSLASEYVQYLQSKLPNGENLVFKITG